MAASIVACAPTSGEINLPYGGRIRVYPKHFGGVRMRQIRSQLAFFAKFAYLTLWIVLYWLLLAAIVELIGGVL